MSLNEQMHEMAGLITDQLGPAFTVKVRPVGAVGETISHWLVTAKVHGDNVDLDVPTEISLKFSGNLMPGSLVHAAVSWLKSFRTGRV